MLYSAISGTFCATEVRPEFIEARSKVKSGASFAVVMNDWDEETKIDFLDWIERDHEEKERCLKKKAATTLAITMHEYIEHLKAIDLRSHESLNSFFVATRSQGLYAKPCSPIILGSEGQVRYHFRPGFIGYEGENVVPENVEDCHGYVGEIKPIANGAWPHLRFALVLGTLFKVLKHGEDNFEPCNFYPHTAECETPYYVVINVVDKSLWLVLAPHYIDHRSRKIETSNIENTWCLLDTFRAGRNSFDAMRIATWEEFCSFDTDPELAGARNLFNVTSMSTAQRIKPRLFAADYWDVMEALNETSASEAVTKSSKKTPVTKATQTFIKGSVPVCEEDASSDEDMIPPGLDYDGASSSDDSLLSLEGSVGPSVHSQAKVREAKEEVDASLATGPQRTLEKLESKVAESDEHAEALAEQHLAQTLDGEAPYSGEPSGSKKRGRSSDGVQDVEKRERKPEDTRCTQEVVSSSGSQDEMEVDSTLPCACRAKMLTGMRPTLERGPHSSTSQTSSYRSTVSGAR